MILDYESFVQHLSGSKNWKVLERHRKKAVLVRYLLAPLIGVSLFVLGIGILLFDSESDMVESGFGAIFLSIPIAIFVYKLAHKHYSKEYKKLLVPQLVSDIIKSYSETDATGNTSVQCEFSHSEHIDEEQLLSIPLFKKYKGSRIFLEGEDLFSGHIGNTEFQFSDLTFKRTRHIPIGDNDTDVNFTIFKGLVFIADYHKSFTGTTTLTTRKGKMYRRLTVPGSRMNTVSHAFDRMFKMTTTDEVTAKYLLPANMLERITHLRKLFPKLGMTLCLHEGMLVITIHNVDFFESDGLKRLDGAGMKRTYDEIKAIMDIIELLNLNLRIWNKQAKAPAQA